MAHLKVTVGVRGACINLSILVYVVTFLFFLLLLRFVMLTLKISFGHDKHSHLKDLSCHRLACDLKNIQPNSLLNPHVLNTHLLDFFFVLCPMPATEVMLHLKSPISVTEVSCTSGLV